MSIWIWVGEKLVGGAVAYVGGKALESVLGDAESFPNNQQVIDAINEAAEDIKRFISNDMRLAFREDAVLKLQGLFEGIRRDLERYSAVEKENRIEYKYLLENADTATSAGIGVANQCGVLAVPCYVNLVSLRIFVIQSLFEISCDKTSYQKFALELREHRDVVFRKMNEYQTALWPQTRVGDVYSWSHTTGGQFPVREYICEFLVDNELRDENRIRGYSNDATSDQAYVQRAIDLWKERQNELMGVWRDMIEKFGNPMRRNADGWSDLIYFIGGGIPLPNV